MRLRANNGIEMLLRNSEGTIICARCSIASRPLRRMRGLLGRRELPAGEGVLLSPGSSVHTFFMRFPIDVVFLDEELVVVGIAPEVTPWRTRGRRGARHILELHAGEAERAGLAVGTRLSLDAKASRSREVSSVGPPRFERGTDGL